MRQISAQWFTTYPIRTAAIVSLAFGVFTAIPKLSSQITSSQQAQQIRLTGQEQTRISEAENDNKLKLLQVRAKLAESRYEQGCIFVVDPNNPAVLTTISEGSPVGQGGSTTGATLPNGTIACDVNGNTGIVREGKVFDVAFTGNQSVVQAAYQRLIHPSPTGEQANGS